MKLAASVQKRKSVFLSWLYSYILILMVPILISCFVYLETDRIVKDEINRSNKALLKQVQMTVDSRISEAKKLGMKISLSQNMQAFGSDSKPVRPGGWIALTRLSTEFMTLTASNEFIDEFYVYFRNVGLVLRPIGSTFPENLYRTVHQDEEFTYEKWHALMNQKYTDSFMVLPSAKQKTEPDQSGFIAYVRSLPIERQNNTYSTLVVLMDQKRFLDAIRNIRKTDQSLVYIIDNQNNVIASTKPFTLSESLGYNRMPLEDGLKYASIDGTMMAISYISSQNTDWRFVSAIPESLFWEKAKYVRKLVFISIGLCLVLGELIAYWFTRRNYRPVIKLVRTLNDKTGLSPIKGHNEYYFLQEAISSTLDEKEKISKMLEQQNTVLRANFLMRLIKGKIGDSISIHDALSSFNIPILSDCFGILLFYIEDFSRLFEGYEETDPEEKKKLVHFIIGNVVEELAGQNNQGFMAEVDEMLACLVNFREENVSNGSQELSRIAWEAHQFIQKEFHIQLSVAISSIHKSFTGIPEAYQEAIEAMEYKIVMGSGQIFSFDQIKPPKKNGFAYYSIDVENQFIKCIKIGHYDEAKSILDRIFNSSFSNGLLPVSMAKCLMFDLVSTMMKTMDELGILCESTFMEQTNPIDRLLKCETIIQLKSEITSVLKDVCDFIDSRKKSHNIELKNRLIEYINQHYHDVNLSISTIAEAFDMNPAYLSRFFKEQTGDGLLDCIAKVRLAKAKQLLRDENINIAEISEKVGYFSINTFLRAFKKYEGITPGRYKEME